MPSAAYDQAVAEATRHHARSKTFSGKFLRPHKPWLTALINKLGIESALDVGAGKGAQYTWVDPADSKTMEEAWGFEVRKYDPAWPPFAAEPTGKYDLVICTHTLGAIPTADLPWMLERLYGFATKAVYIAEKLGPLKKTVLSNPGAHPIEWTAEQWMEAIRPFAEASAVQTHLSFRERGDEGVTVTRYRTGAGKAFRWIKMPAAAPAA